MMGKRLAGTDWTCFHLNPRSTNCPVVSCEDVCRRFESCRMCQRNCISLNLIKPLYFRSSFNCYMDIMNACDLQFFELKAFSQELGHPFQFIHKCKSKIGFSFGTGKHGLDSIICRSRDCAVFSYQKSYILREF